MLRLKKSHPNLDEFIEYSLLVFGYVVIDDFFSETDNLFINLKSKHLKDLSLENLSKNNDYEGGFCKTYINLLEVAKKNKKSVNSIDRSNNTIGLKELVRLPLILKTANRFFQSKNLKIDVFQTLDTPKSNHIAQKPHFDRLPTLKFMLYLSDVSIDNGALELSSSSHHWVQKTFPLPRPKFDDTKYFKKTRELPKPILENLKPIEGKAGTLIIFHTDTIHRQGIVNTGECRIIRSHFRNKYEKFNRKLIIPKLRNYLSLLLKKFS